MTVDNLSLAGKFALVTGSGREDGLGAGIARTLAKNGAAVAIHYVSESSKPKAANVAAAISKDFGVKVTVVSGTVDEVSSAKKIVADTLTGLGTDHIDILSMFISEESF